MFAMLRHVSIPFRLVCETDLTWFCPDVIALYCIPTPELGKRPCSRRARASEKSLPGVEDAIADKERLSPRRLRIGEKGRSRGSRCCQRRSREFATSLTRRATQHGPHHPA